MKTISMIIIISAASVPALALNVLVPGYTVETYATYTDSVQGPPGEMTFDDGGNLYVTQYISETIWRITPSRVAGQFASGLYSVNTIAWGGGTAYGDYLYAGELPVYKVDLSGNKTSFASVRCDASMDIDRTGNYGGFLYMGTGCNDDIKRIDTAGNVTTFSSWPGTASGAPYGMAFDPGTAYGGLMYVGCAFEQVNASISGLFTLNTSGTPTRFSSNLVQAYALDFDKTGLFGGLLFAIGKTAFSSPAYVYTVNTDGIAAEFAASAMLNALGMTFGPDGALYVCEYDGKTGLVTISRISPEMIIVQVAVDFKPTSCPNPLNLKSKGLFPAAILGSEFFDVREIDPASIRLAGISPIRSSYEDVATPPVEANDCKCSSEGPDGFVDFTIKFDKQKLVKQIMLFEGKISRGDIFELTLTGTLFDERPIEGTDCIVIVGNPDRQKPSKNKSKR